ncbi:MAG: DUF1801 domain-containing protein [Bacteroidetes bacterium]|nr:DUF1801 domain-containing protein [Bacteroidota bacterium]
MATPKTVPHDASVVDFLNAVENPERKADAMKALDIMMEVTGEKPKMWGPSIVGFGSYHYVYASGREGDWPLTGFSPRKQALTLYIMAGFGHYDELMSRLGKHKTGKSCLYVKRLSDIDESVLRELIAASVDHMKSTYGQ